MRWHPPGIEQRFVWVQDSMKLMTLASWTRVKVSFVPTACAWRLITPWINSLLGWLNPPDCHQKLFGSVLVLLDTSDVPFDYLCLSGNLVRRPFIDFCKSLECILIHVRNRCWQTSLFKSRGHVSKGSRHNSIVWARKIASQCDFECCMFHFLRIRKLLLHQATETLWPAKVTNVSERHWTWWQRGGVGKRCGKHTKRRNMHEINLQHRHFQIYSIYHNLQKRNLFWQRPKPLLDTWSMGTNYLFDIAQNKVATIWNISVTRRWPFVE